MRGGLRRVWSVVCILSIGAGAASAQEKAKTPAKPASPAKRASIYDKTADARTQIAKATARAKEDNQARPADVRRRLVRLVPQAPRPVYQQPPDRANPVQ